MRSYHLIIPAVMILLGLLLFILGINEGRLPEVVLPVVVWSWWGVAKVVGFVMLWVGLVFGGILCMAYTGWGVR